MKKLLNTIIIVSLFLMLTACNNTANDVTNQEVDNKTPIKTEQKDGIIFTTEYNLEDYIENVAIISKNDGLLYGVLNDKGKEIIPIKYDSIEFINKEEYLENQDENIYMVAEYENTNVLYNTSGKVILEAENKLGYIKYYTSVDKYNQIPTFYEITENEYVFYDKKANVLSKIPKEFEYDENYNSLRFISDKCFICSDKEGDGVMLYDFNGNLLHHFNGYFMPTIEPSGTKSCTLSFSYSNFKENNVQVIINKEGQIIEEKVVETQPIIMDIYRRGNKEKYNLYKSNGTWKLEDLNGNTLYDDRYYNAFQFSGGENDCYCLTNEDNQIMIINRNGKKCIDYGVFETTKDSEKVTMNREDSKQTVTEIFEGKHGIAIPMKSLGDNGYDIYYFSLK